MLNENEQIPILAGPFEITWMSDDGKNVELVEIWGVLGMVVIQLMHRK